jgi:hypothetical protein
MLLVEGVDDVAHLASLLGQLDADRAAVDARALVIEEAHLDELEIVGDVGAEIITTRAQLAGGELLVADILQQQRLYGVDVGAAAAVEFIPDDVEQPAMQPLDQRQGIEIERANVVEPTFAIGSTALAAAFSMTPPCLFCFVTARPCSPLDIHATPQGLKSV